MIICGTDLPWKTRKKSENARISTSPLSIVGKIRVLKVTRVAGSKSVHNNYFFPHCRIYLPPCRRKFGRKSDLHSFFWIIKKWIKLTIAFKRPPSIQYFQQLFFGLGGIEIFCLSGNKKVFGFRERIYFSAIGVFGAVTRHQNQFNCAYIALIVGENIRDRPAKLIQRLLKANSKIIFVLSIYVH